jgi:hypothetical protein
MSDSLRDRIAAVLREHVEDQLTNYDAERNECGCGNQGLSGYKDHVADAVIEALGSDCIYRYACANCGDFWFNKSERMQRFALLHSRSHLAVIQETKQCEKAGGGFSQWHRYVTDWTTDE